MPVTRVALEKRRGKRGSETKKKRRDEKGREGARRGGEKEEGWARET